MKVVTESGSVYVIGDGQVSRVNPDGVMRRDGEWLRVLNKPTVEVGERLLFVLEPLGDGDVTTRLTSPVVSIS